MENSKKHIMYGIITNVIFTCIDKPRQSKIIYFICYCNVKHKIDAYFFYSNTVDKHISSSDSNVYYNPIVGDLIEIEGNLTHNGILINEPKITVIKKINNEATDKITQEHKCQVTSVYKQFI